MAAELLPWLQVLIVPALGLLLRIEGRLSRLEASRDADAARLLQLERRIAGLA